ncbi:aspartyl protease family protein At5g10770-like [Humulus lupulus]|uniref:aspartyl protease family protein At5g10770-like n=1 Tax=Humulus lupulus TaxID=3486 RepID=UPI002B411C20|nr:aspartyl protease family protein At5g10770-like [Humulus lupulus]
MGSLWFLGLYLLLVSVSSSTAHVFQEKDSFELSIYHVKTNDSSLNPKSHFEDIVSNDNERLKTLYYMLSQNNTNTMTSSSFSTYSHNPKDLKSVSVTLNSGMSIGSGNYYVKVGLGSPPKYYSMIIDTGSSFSWLQCQPCTIYCHNQVEPVFDPKASKTYRHLSCRSPECSSLKQATLNDPFCDAGSNCLYTTSYGDGSFSIGYLSQDRLTITPTQILPSFVYGCGQDNQGLFGRAAGILGLARNKLSLINQVSAKYGYAFSYCLPSFEGGQGGVLSIGTTAVSSPAFKYTPMVASAKIPSLYFLKLTAITVGMKPLGVAATSYRVLCIIDSGTVITRLPTPLYTALSKAFAAIVSTKFAKAPAISILDTCFKGSPSAVSAAVPQIQLLFQGGAGLKLGPKNSILEAEKGVSCLAFAQSNDYVIIGNRQQQTYKVAYDVAKSRIGFAPGGCR